MQKNFIVYYQYFTRWRLAFDMDAIKSFEEIYKDDKLESPYRHLLKDIFQYADHVGNFTFRNYSLA